VRIAKAPSTLPARERIGVDQHARRPFGKASARKSCHSGSPAMSDTTTCRRGAMSRMLAVVVQQ